MTPTTCLDIEVSTEYPTHEAALFIAELDNLSERMHAATKMLQPIALSWQMAPGLNTVGMLLLHIAIWEVYLIRRIVEEDQEAAKSVETILGIPMSLEGIPLPKDGMAPTELADKEYSFFEAILHRARAYSKGVALRMTEEDFARVVSIGNEKYPQNATPRWALFHVLEHFAGHRAQIMYILHMMQIASSKPQPV